MNLENKSSKVLLLILPLKSNVELNKPALGSDLPVLKF